MERPIQDVARLSGTTSRALRHYGELGLLPASRIGAGGTRYYDEESLARLQRILLLRQLGLGLPAIAEVLAGQREHAEALTAHLDALRNEMERLDRQIASVETTIEKLRGGEQLMAEEMFDGFDHTSHRAEVEERWGAEAYASGDRWWRSMSAAQKTEWVRRQKRLASDWADAAARGIDADSAEAQSLALRHYEWLRGIPGTPQTPTGDPTKEYFVGLGEMYVGNPRFAANYGGDRGARFVRDAMTVYADRNL